MVNDVRCGRETRELVQAAARKLNYVPDPVFAAMGSRQRRSGAHGLPIAYLESLVPGPHQGGPYLKPAQERAKELGYRLEVVDLTRWESAGRLWSVLYARGFAGVLVGSVRTDRHKFLLGNERFPVVCAGRIDVLPYNTVRPSILQGVKTAFEHMMSLGYRRIGCAIMRHDPPVEDDFERYAATLGCQSEWLKTRDRVPLLRAQVEDAQALADWYAKYRPDAVLGFHMGMIQTLRSAGWSVPGDTGFACLHLLEEESERFIAGGVAGVNQNYAQIARSSINLLDQMIRHGESGTPSCPIRIEVESIWSDGASLPPRG